MAFSRMAKKAEPAPPEASQDAARKEAIEEAKQKAVEDARWKESHAGFGSAFKAPSQAQQQPQEQDEEKIREERIARSKAEAARRAQASGGGGFGGAPSGGGGFGSGSKSEFSWKKQGPAPGAAGKGAGKGGRGGGNLPSYDSFAGGGNLPSHDDCEQAISAMVSRTTAGMKEGLLGLGLPEYPLHFVPGRELKLCGHDVREVINEMIHAWMTEEKEAFYKVLVRIKGIVANPIITEEDELGGLMPQAAKTAVSSTQPAKREPWSKTPAAEEDDDDEVIDMEPKGDRQAAPKPAPPKEVSTPAPAPAPAKPELEDYYQLLGVDPTATLQEIRLKFRSLVVTEHPEKGGDAKKFAKLNKAYSVLSDSEKRKAFDGQRLAALEIID